MRTHPPDIFPGAATLKQKEDQEKDHRVAMDCKSQEMSGNFF